MSAGRRGFLDTRTLALAITLIVGVSTASCRSEPPPSQSSVAATPAPAPLEPPSPVAPRAVDLVEHVEEHLRIVEEMAAAAQSYGSNCQRLAAALQAIASRHTRYFVDADRLALEPEVTAKLEVLAAPLEERSEAAMRKLEAAHDCLDDEAVTAALEAMPL